jgi:hypothetical protein
MPEIPATRNSRRHLLLLPRQPAVAIVNRCRGVVRFGALCSALQRFAALQARGQDCGVAIRAVKAFAAGHQSNVPQCLKMSNTVRDLHG